MRQPLLLPIALLAVTAAGCSDADPAAAATRRFANTGFTQVIVEASDDVTISKGAFAIAATGDQDVLDRLEIRQDGATLRIGRKKGSNGWSRTSARVAVSLPALVGVTVSGSGNAAADVVSGPTVGLRVSGSGDLAVGKVAGDALAVGVSGSGNLTLGSAAVKTVSASISGSGDAALSGTCSALDVRLSGSGDLAAATLACTNAALSTSGSGDIAIKASGSVTARTSGSGDITVTGGARCNSRASGSGVIRCN